MKAAINGMLSFALNATKWFVRANILQFSSSSLCNELRAALAAMGLQAKQYSNTAES
jgi:hypothetical protein